VSFQIRSAVSLTKSCPVLDEDYNLRDADLLLISRQEIIEQPDLEDISKVMNEEYLTSIIGAEHTFLALVSFQFLKGERVPQLGIALETFEKITSKNSLEEDHFYAYKVDNLTSTLREF
jgi:hypothetical protein